MIEAEVLTGDSDGRGVVRLGLIAGSLIREEAIVGDVQTFDGSDMDVRCFCSRWRCQVVKDGDGGLSDVWFGSRRHVHRFV